MPTCSGGAGHERDSNVGAGHQSHVPLGDRDALDLAARADRRPHHLPGFLRLRGLGLLPVNPSEIKQIEVIRGPASAVWGANALTGVVNVITKTPREFAGVGLS